MSGFLIRSLVLSAVLTVLLNGFLAWRGRRPTDDVFGRSEWSGTERPTVDRRDDAGARPTVRVFFPWKAMLIASIGLTVALNLLAWLAR